MRLDNYWWLLLWPLLFGLACHLLNTKRIEEVDGRLQVRWWPISAVIMSVPFVIWAGWREWFVDTEQYRRTFLAMPSTFQEIIPYLRGVEKGHGFRLIELLFKCFFGDADKGFFLFIAAIQIACLVYIYRKYSTNFWFSFFLFIASTDYLSWVFNGMRQFTAASIIFLCVPLIAKRRYIPAVIIVLLMATVHISALVFLPFVFVVNGRFRNYRTLIFVLVMVVAIVFEENVTGFLIDAMEGTAYSGDIIFLKSNNGTNILRVLFYSVPAIMSFCFRSFLDEERDPLINVCANLSIVTAAFYVFSFFTSGILMGSIPIYFSLSNYILIPWLIRKAFTRRSVVVAEALFVLVYIAFFYYQCGPTWGIL